MAGLPANCYTLLYFFYFTLPYPGSIPATGHLARYVTSHPGQLSLGRCNEYQPKGGDAQRLGVQTRNGSCVGGG